MSLGPVGQIADGAFTNLAVLTVALAQEEAGGEFRLGTDSIYMAEYGQTDLPCTSIKYYITWYVLDGSLGVFQAIPAG